MLLKWPHTHEGAPHAHECSLKTGAWEEEISETPILRLDSLEWQLFIGLE